MMRRDYILRVIEEFMRVFSRLDSFKRGQKWNEVAEVLDDEFQNLIGHGAKGVAQLSETDLLARLMNEGPTHLFREKAFILVTLLKEAGDLATAENRIEEGWDCYLKSLHILFEVLARGEVFEFPEFVPKVELLLSALQSAPLPLRTQAMVMQHYERSGEFAKAEDTLFTMFDAEPENGAIVNLGIAFYERLKAQSDDALIVGNLPRKEIEEGLAELRSQQKLAQVDASKK